LGGCARSVGGVLEPYFIVSVTWVFSPSEAPYIVDGTPDMTTKPEWIDSIVSVGFGNGKGEAIRVSELWVWSTSK